MVPVYFYSALVGGSLLICQFVVTLLGFGGGDHADGHDLGGDHDGGDHDVTHEASSAWFVGVLTFRTVVAALTFFGFAGMAASTNRVPAPATFLIALTAGISALYIVAWMMRTIHGLKADGTVHIENVLAEHAVVYVMIPAGKTGRGKITVRVQDRTEEYDAVTAGPELPSGTAVVVVAILGSDTVEVARAPVPEGVLHA